MAYNEDSVSRMNIVKLSEADKHLLLGLILKKERSVEMDRKALKIIRSDSGLDQKIDAILELNRREEETEQPGTVSDGPGMAHFVKREPFSHTESGKRAVLVLDTKRDLYKVLKRSSLKKNLRFIWVEDNIEGLLHLRQARIGAILCNQNDSLEENLRYADIVHSIKPRVSLIFLCPPNQGLPRHTSVRDNVKFLSKPVKIERVKKTIRELILGQETYSP